MNIFLIKTRASAVLIICLFFLASALIFGTLFFVNINAVNAVICESSDECQEGTSCYLSVCDKCGGPWLPKQCLTALPYCPIATDTYCDLPSACTTTPGTTCTKRACSLTEICYGSYPTPRCYANSCSSAISTTGATCGDEMADYHDISISFSYSVCHTGGCSDGEVKSKIMSAHASSEKIVGGQGGIICNGAMAGSGTCSMRAHCYLSQDIGRVCDPEGWNNFEALNPDDEIWGALALAKCQGNGAQNIRMARSTDLIDTINTGCSETRLMEEFIPYSDGQILNDGFTDINTCVLSDKSYTPSGRTLIDATVTCENRDCACTPDWQTKAGEWFFGTCSPEQGNPVCILDTLNPVYNNELNNCGIPMDVGTGVANGTDACINECLNRTTGIRERVKVGGVLFRKFEDLNMCVGDDEDANLYPAGTLGVKGRHTVIGADDDLTWNLDIDGDNFEENIKDPQTGEYLSHQPIVCAPRPVFRKVYTNQIVDGQGEAHDLPQFRNFGPPGSIVKIEGQYFVSNKLKVHMAGRDFIFKPLCLKDKRGRWQWEELGYNEIEGDIMYYKNFCTDPADGIDPTDDPEDENGDGFISLEMQGPDYVHVDLDENQYLLPYFSRIKILLPKDDPLTEDVDESGGLVLCNADVSGLDDVVINNIAGAASLDESEGAGPHTFLLTPEVVDTADLTITIETLLGGTSPEDLTVPTGTPLRVISVKGGFDDEQGANKVSFVDDQGTAEYIPGIEAILAEMEYPEEDDIEYFVDQFYAGTNYWTDEEIYPLAPFGFNRGPVRVYLCSRSPGSIVGSPFDELAFAESEQIVTTTDDIVISYFTPRSGYIEVSDYNYIETDPVLRISYSAGSALPDRVFFLKDTGTVDEGGNPIISETESIILKALETETFVFIPPQSQKAGYDSVKVCLNRDCSLTAPYAIEPINKRIIRVFPDPGAGLDLPDNVYIGFPRDPLLFLFEPSPGDTDVYVTYSDFEAVLKEVKVTAGVCQDSPQCESEIKQEAILYVPKIITIYGHNFLKKIRFTEPIPESIPEYAVGIWDISVFFGSTKASLVRNGLDVTSSKAEAELPYTLTEGNSYVIRVCNLEICTDSAELFWFVRETVSAMPLPRVFETATKPNEEGYYPGSSRIIINGMNFGGTRLDENYKEVGKAYLYALLPEYLELNTSQPNGILTWSEYQLDFKVPRVAINIGGDGHSLGTGETHYLSFHSYAELCGVGCRTFFLPELGTMDPETSGDTILSIKGPVGGQSNYSRLRLFPKFKDGQTEKRIELLSYNNWSDTAIDITAPAYWFFDETKDASLLGAPVPGHEREYAPYFLVCTSDGCSSNLVYEDKDKPDVGKPEIFGLSKGCGYIWDKLTIYGYNFGGEQGASRVLFNGGGESIPVLPEDYLFWSPSRIVVRVPVPPGGADDFLELNGQIVVERGADKAISHDVFWGGDECPAVDNVCVQENASPQITSVETGYVQNNEAYVGNVRTNMFDPLDMNMISNPDINDPQKNKITIKGCRFLDVQGKSFVSIGDFKFKDPAIYNSWEDEEIVLNVPYDAVSGDVMVHIWNGLNFQTSRPSADTINILPTIQYMQRRGIPGQVFGIWGSDFCASYKEGGCAEPGAIIMGRYEMTDFPSAGDLFSAPGQKTRIIEWNRRRILAVVPEELDLGSLESAITAESGLVQIIRPDLKASNHTLLTQNSGVLTVPLTQKQPVHFSILPVVSRMIPQKKEWQKFILPIEFRGRNMAGCKTVLGESSDCPLLWGGMDSGIQNKWAPTVEIGSYITTFLGNSHFYGYTTMSELALGYLEGRFQSYILTSTFPINLFGKTHNVIITNWDSTRVETSGGEMKPIGSFGMLKRNTGVDSYIESVREIFIPDRVDIADPRIKISFGGLIGRQTYSYGRLNEPATRIISASVPIENIEITSALFEERGEISADLTIDQGFLGSVSARGEKNIIISVNDFVPLWEVFTSGGGSESRALAEKFGIEYRTNNRIPTFGAIETQSYEISSEPDKRGFTATAYNSIERYQGNCMTEATGKTVCPYVREPGKYNEGDPFAAYGVYKNGGLKVNYPSPILNSVTVDYDNDRLAIKGSRFYRQKQPEAKLKNIENNRETTLEFEWIDSRTIIIPNLKKIGKGKYIFYLERENTKSEEVEIEIK